MNKEVKKLLSCFVIVFLSCAAGQTAYSQCKIEIVSPAHDTTICEGEEVFLRSVGDCDDDYLMNADFNDGKVGRGWLQTSAARFDNPCGDAYDDSTYFWIGASKVHLRYLETRKFNIPSGAKVSFYLKYPPHTAEPKDAPCEGPDIFDLEGVELQYSTDYSPWRTFPDWYWPPSKTENGILYNWKYIEYDLPDEVCKPNTSFRWIQKQVSNVNFDHWGIDDVEIKADLPPGKIKWSHGPEVHNPPAVKPTQTTTYVVTIDNGYTKDADTVTVYVCPKPVKHDTISYILCYGDTAKIGYPAEGLAQNSIIEWEPSRGLNRTDIAQPDASPSVSTTYIRTISNTCDHGCVCKSIDTVFVEVNPEITMNLPDDMTICSGDTIKLPSNVSGGKAPYNYVWEPEDYVIETGRTLTAVPQEDILYHLTVIDESGCSIKDSVSIKVNPSPQIDLERHIRICAGDTAVIGSDAYGGEEPYTYEWTPKTGLKSPNSSITEAYPTETTLYELTVTGANGCIIEVEVLVEIEPIPHALAGDDVLLCYGDSVSIGEEAFCGVEPFTYKWSPVEGLSDPTAFSTWASPDETTEYIVTVTDGIGRTAKDSVVITVNPELFCNLADSIFICKDSSVNIIPDISGGTPQYKYQWTNDNNADIFQIKDITVNPPKTTRYYLSVEDSNNCLIEDSIEVIVNPLPLVEAGESTTICAGDIYKIGSEAQNGTPPYSYLWFPADSLKNPNEAVTSARPVKSTIYTLYVSDSNGCRAVDSVFVTVNPVPTAEAGSNATICRGEEVFIGDTAKCGQKPFTYEWVPAEGLSDPYSPVTKAFPEETTVYIVKATDALERFDYDTVTVVVNPLPYVKNFPDTLICYGDVISIGNEAEGGKQPYKYFWQPENQIVETDEHYASVSPDTIVSYIQTTIDDNGCVTYDTIVVEVDTQLQLEITGQKEVCYGRPFTLQAEVSGGTPPYHYQWQPFGSVKDPNSSEAEIEKEFNNMYTVTVTDALGCDIRDSINIDFIYSEAIVSAPKLTADPHEKNFYIPIYLNKGSTILECNPDSVSLKVKIDATIFNPLYVTNGTLTKELKDFFWEMIITAENNNWENGETLTEIVGDVLLGRTDTTIIDIDSCDWHDLLLETQLIDGELTLKNICMEETPRFLNYDFKGSILSIMPNPASGKTTVLLSTPLDAQNHSLEIVDILGKTVYSENWRNRSSESGLVRKRIEVNTTKFESGIYRTIYSNDKGISAEELVIIR